MTMLIDQAIGLSVVLVVVLAASLALHRRSAALRHWVIAAGMLSTFALPVARLLVPAWSVVPLPSSIQVGSASIADPATTKPAAQGVSRIADAPASATLSVAPVGDALVAAWAVGAAVNLLVLLAGIFRLTWHARHARVLHAGPWRRAADRVCAEMAIGRPVTVLETSSSTMLGAWGWRRPRILLPRGADQWPDQDVGLVMRHELAHIARADWCIQLAAEALRAVHWFNPLTWIACARLRLESERACDDEVLGAGVRGDDYALCLVHLATLLRSAHRRWASYPAPGMARSTSLQRRVTAMLAPGLVRTAVTARSRTFIAALAFALTLPVASLAVLAQGQDRFSGSVVDQSGKNMANVRITLTQADSNARHEIRSDDRGHFEFAGLAPGNYDVEVSQPGFATLKGTIAVAPGGLTRDLRLQLGSVQETVHISGKPRPAAPAAKPPRQPQLQPCTPTAMGGNVRPPLKLIDVKPDYPEGLLAAKVGGLVKVEGILAGDGTVRDMRVVETPHPDLGASVVVAVGKWRFTPTLLNCEPADITIKVNANFVLE